jgi:hypothetical protein
MQALSLGARLDPWPARSGVVHSVFRRVVNLLVDGELWTVLGISGHHGPFGIRVAAADCGGGFDVRVADPVHVRGGWLRIGSLVIDCRIAPSWSPASWREPHAGLEPRLAAVEQAARERAWIGSAAMAGELSARLHEASDAQLEIAVRAIVGRGPGLTPAGDDVLVGMLTAFTCAGGSSGTNFAARLGRALEPALPATTDISRHLLAQAARGLPGRALHELGRTLFEAAPEAEARSALATVLDTGATSGADACLGLVAAIRCLFPLTARLAA